MKYLTRLARVPLAVYMVLVTACSNGALTRSHAESALREQLSLPADERHEFTVRGVTLCEYASEGQLQGLLTVRSVRNWTNKCWSNVQLSPLGQEFSLSGRHVNRYLTDTVVDVILSRVSFGEITGIAVSGDGTTASVEYTLRRSHVTPFGAVRAVREGAVPLRATFRKYDDGWRVERSGADIELAPARLSDSQLAALVTRAQSAPAYGASSAVADSPTFDDEVEAVPPTAEDFADPSLVIPPGRSMPVARVPLTPAADVSPSWSKSEDVEGDYPVLTGLYVGALGDRPFKLVVSDVDTLRRTLSGFSNLSNRPVPFEGTYSLRIVSPDARAQANVLSTQKWVFEAMLFEPEGVQSNGVFQVRFEGTDVQGTTATGTWTSYGGTLYRGIKLIDTYVASNR